MLILKLIFKKKAFLIEKGLTINLYKILSQLTEIIIMTEMTTTPAKVLMTLFEL